METRFVDPWAVVTHVGLMYLVGWDQTREAPRYFRLDRAGEIKILDQTRSKEPPSDLASMIRNSYIKNPLESSEEATVVFRGSVQKNLERIVSLTSVEDYPDRKGWKKARCSIRDRAWFREVIRSFGESIEILSPEEPRMEFLEDVHNLREKLKSFLKSS